MANASIDSNSKPTMTALLNTDGKTITRIQADSATHALEVDDNTSGSDNGGTYAETDENGRPTLFAVSSVDGVTLVALYTDSTGHLLIDSQ